MSTPPPSACEPQDPRIRRTRKLLQDALEKLLEKKDFDRISVQDIVDEATINRATFYDHYGDKFALLECVIAGRFLELLSQRDVRFEGPCTSALRTLMAGLCEFLARMRGPMRERRIDPHTEQAVVSVLRKMVLDGLREHPLAWGVPPEMVAAAVSGAMYGAAREWAQAPQGSSPETAAETVMRLVDPIFAPAPEDKNAQLGARQPGVLIP